ncbi:acetate/propionate family kinase [Salinifilum aidingensis]
MGTTAVITVNPGSNSLRLETAAVDENGTCEVLDSTSTATSPTSDESLAEFDRFLRAHAEHATCLAHRLVHGGEHVTRPRRVDESTLTALGELETLAPLHVPATVQLIRRSGNAHPGLTQVLCPDTGFHRALPPEARTEPLPARWQGHVRRYGFHGLSYAWALRRTTEILGRGPEQIQVLLAHLGGGCSACAVHSGRSVDTTMGLTPLGGMAMSRRSGDLDPGLLFWLLRHSDEDTDTVERALHGEAGLLGLSGGRSGDTRDLVAAADDGDDDARLALRVFAKRAAAGIASMATNLDTIDALVFTGEIGWNQPEVRRDICRRLSLLGLPGELSGNRADDGPVSAPEQHPAVLVVKPREELQLALEAAAALRPRAQ